MTKHQAACAPQDDQEQAAAETQDVVQEGQEAEETVETLKALLAEKESAYQQLTDRYMRLTAEYDNYRRRTQKEKDALYESSLVDVVANWLPLLDNLERAELSAGQYDTQEARQIAQGIAMIAKQAADILAQLDVEAIDCCGQPFDPNLHDAVMHVADEAVGPSTVVEELKKGYKRNDRVIRYSVVKVAN